MKTILSKCFMSLIAFAVAGVTITRAQQPRIALLLSDKGQHHDEFDNALNVLHWQADRYRCTPNEMQKLVANLSNYDMLIAAPLFWPNPPDKQDAKTFRSFIENGGMLVVTDGSYSETRNWMAGIDPRFGGLETGECTSSQWAVNGYTKNAEPAHPLRTFPSAISEPDSWPHFLEPSKDTKWQLVAKCSEGFPATFAQTIGRGLVSFSALRQPGTRQIVNNYACLQLTRAGIELQSFNMSEPAFGDGRICLTFKGRVPQNGSGFIYEIVPKTGKPQRFEGEIVNALFELPYRITVRGPVTIRLLLRTDGQTIPLFEHQAELPQLLTVKPPAYRGLLSTARRVLKVIFGIALAPDGEKIESAGLLLTVLDAGGNGVMSTNLVLAPNDVPLAWHQPLALDPSLPAGNYSLQAVLTDAKNANQKLAEAETSFKILTPSSTQTIIDEDGTFLVNGKPFFPLGLYHVQPDDYKDVAALGINTVQFWAWHLEMDKDGVSRGLARATAEGLKVVYEFNHKLKHVYENATRDLAGNPAILMWYGVDEPSEGSYATAKELCNTLHQGDENHPVYTVSCRKDAYAEHASFADVFAIDPYGKPANAAESLPLAVTALKGEKPLLCVPGAFGKDETPEEMRAVAYLALAYDARGIIWYPWSQTGGGPLGIGCKNNPVQQTTISNICAEITLMLPLLTTPVRQIFASEDGKLRCLYMRGRQNCVLMVNSTSEELQTKAFIPSIAPRQGKINVDMKDFFKKRKDGLEVKEGQFSIALEPYETRVYVW